MGIHLDYRGKLADLSRLDELIGEVKAFCRQAHWEYLEVDEHLDGIRFGSLADDDPPRGSRKKKSGLVRTHETHPDEFVEHNMGSLTMWFDQVHPNLMDEAVRGIYCYPPGTESVNLVFDGSGNLCTYMELGEHMVKGRFQNVKHYMFSYPFTKTTGCIEEHILICQLLKLLQQKYIPKLKVRDSTGYFQSGNEKDLRLESMAMSAFVGMLRQSPGLVKGMLDLPDDAELTDVTDEFNESQRQAVVARLARGKTVKKARPRPS